MGIKNFLKKIKRKIVIEKKIPVNIPVLQGMLLKGKTACIVGGAGGIGFAIAEQLVKNGCYVVIVGTKESKLKKAVTQLGVEYAQYSVIDIMDIAMLHEKFTHLVESLGNQRQLDICVNCAGIHGPEQFWEITEKDWDTVMNVNLKGMFFMCQEVGKYMRDNHIKGHILNIGSASGLKPAWTPYEISKWGVRAMTLGVAREMVKYGIIVNCLAPGPTATPMLNFQEGQQINWEGNPSGRVAMPEEIANWAVFLVSDLGNLVVGNSLYVTGGSGTICIDK